MLKSCPRIILTLLFLSSLFLFFASPALAARTINSATLNGSSSVTVLPSASITASVTVTTSGGGTSNDWNSTSWQISGQGVNCINHTNHTSAGTFSENFTVTAPGSDGVYSISFIAYQNDGCSQNPSGTSTLSNSITVSTPTPTPTPTPTSEPPTPTPTLPPGTTPTPTPTSGPTPTTNPNATATPTSSESNSTSTTYYPSANLANYTPNPTNISSLTFTGTATIEQGTIENVEYSVTGGSEWLETFASDGQFNGKDELFSFSPPPFSEGTHTIQVRAKSAAGVTTQSDSYGSDTVTIITTPPTVSLDIISPNPTKNTRPEITGSATSNLGTITRVETSLNGGQTFLPASLSGSNFTITTEALEDGNYEVIARAFDNAGNVGVSAPQTLIIDTIPPIIGGSVLSFGPQVLVPNNNGEIVFPAGTEITIAISMKGGVTESLVKGGKSIFSLAQMPNSNIWVGKIHFEEGGEKNLMIEAIDGAQNKTERPFQIVRVEEFGKIIDKSSKQPVEDAKVSLFFFERISRQWIPWEAASYGQTNPEQTDKGQYSFILPSGKYYLGVDAPGFNTAQSEIIELSQTSIINYPLQLTSKLKLELQLPFIGKVILSLPQFSPPDSIQVKPLTPETLEPIANTSQPKPNIEALTLLNLQGKEVNLESYRGKKLLLSFISTWSLLSQEQVPFLSEASKELPNGQAMLAVALQEGVSTVQSFMKRGNYTFPIVSDKDGLSANAFKVNLLPYHVLIDAEGKIFSTYTGVLNTNELLKNLNDMP